MKVTTRRGRVTAVLTCLVLAAGTLALSAGTPAAQGADPEGDGPLFTPLPGFEPPRPPRARVRPDEFAAFDVRVGGVAARLGDAPRAPRARRGAPPAFVTLPDPDGEPVRFAVQRARFAEAGFEAAHPELRAWRGRAVDDPTVRLALDTTPMGLHAFVRGDSGRSWLIDPAENRPGTTEHLSYYEDAVDAPPFDFRAPLEPPRRDGAAARGGGTAAGSTRDRSRPAARPGPGEAVPLRTYRLALVTDPSYAEFFGTENVAAEKVTLVNRVNQIYNDDLGVRLLLVDGTDDLNLDTPAKASGPDGPCGASPCYPTEDLKSCSGALLDRNIFALGQIIGADNYDVGHIGLGTNGGGLAGVGVVGDYGRAAGCTGLPVPTGDFYAVDYVAHEIGHQFGGNHTFNGVDENCSGANRDPDASVEPGSGSSVMAYAGICGRDDLQEHTDPYFSQRTLDEVDGYVTRPPFAESELATIALSGWDSPGDAVRLSVPGRTPVQIDYGPGYTAASIRTKIRQLTGYTPYVFGYDTDFVAGVNDGGFGIDFLGTDGEGVDIPRITVENAGGDATGFAGVQAQGGPGTNRGYAVSSSTNHAPSVIAPVDRTLPTRTPFELTGTGSDADGDELVYLWEQNDEGLGEAEGDALLSNAKTDGPLFRVFGSKAVLDDPFEYEAEGSNTAGTSPTRTFPDLEQLLAGDTNADTGECPEPPESGEVPDDVRACYAEFLPTGDYAGDPDGEGPVLSFRLTARDLSLAGGGTAYDDVALTVDRAAGPFRVTSQDEEGAVREGGSTETVTWDVNGTDAEALAPQVRITMSADGGRTFPYVLARATANDGSAEITWPAVFSDEARLRVEAVDNYFFDVNDTDIAVATDLAVTADPGTATAAYSDALDEQVEITARSADVDADELSIEVSGVGGLVATPVSTSEDGVHPSTAVWQVDGTIAQAPGVSVADVVVSEPAEGGSGTAQVPVEVRPETAVLQWTGPAEALIDETVTFSADVADAEDGSPGDVTGSRLAFVDRDDDDAEICSAPVTGTSAAGSATCEATFEAPGERTVGLVLTGNHASDTADDDVSIDVTAPDETPPETSITGGPGKLRATNQATLSYGADEDDVSFACTLDGEPEFCDGDPVLLRGLSSGMHRFEVAATDQAGNTDETPAVRQFAVAWDDRQLQRAGGWTRRRSGNAFRQTFLQTRRSGSRVWRYAAGVTRVGVVVGTSPGGGAVDLLVRGQRVRRIDLDGPWRLRKVVVVTMPSTSGRFEVRSRGGGRVRLDGLALFQP